MTKQFTKRKTRKVNDHSVMCTPKQRTALVSIWLTSPYDLAPLSTNELQTINALVRRGLLEVRGGYAYTTKVGDVFAGLDNLMGDS